MDILDLFDKYEVSFPYSLFIFQIHTLLYGLAVVTVRNPIHSILFLIGVFISTTTLFAVYLYSYFLAMILIIVYLGAVCVLFLFIVMMLNIKVLELKRQINFIPFFFVFLSTFIVFFLEEIWDFHSILNFSPFFNLKGDDIELYFQQEPYIIWKIDIMKSLGLILYTFYVLQFISASLVLLVAMIGAIFLTLDVISKGKKQNPYFQLARSRSLFFTKI